MSDTVEPKELKAKGVSLWGEIFGAVWIAGFGAFYIIKNIATMNPVHIIWFGIAIVACFSPVYLNLLMEKVCHKVEQDDVCISFVRCCCHCIRCACYR